MSRRYLKPSEAGTLEATRERILDAARTCYARQGIAGTTLDDIAGEAGLTRRTIYRYFSNKKAVIQAIVDEQACDFMEVMRRDLKPYGDDFLVFLKQFVLYLIQRGPEAPGHKLLLGKRNAALASQYYFTSNGINNFWNELVHQSFSEAQASQQIRPDLSYEDLILWVGRMVHSFIQFPVPEKKLNELIDRFIVDAIRC